MRRRRLTPETIVPENLYVERQADRDLDRIVDEMGRPGYVLVARQMGKTNLLLHMKQRRERAGDLVVYFDLSNRFEALRDLFRWIIDGVIERSGIDLADVEATISRGREVNDIAPHIEYDRHLREILKSVGSQRLILVLDEVDSLSAASFSDAFWAQVRSMYFARANYPEYRRLTYVLSGVAEPSDLIRDKSISPFNIGEKVYLDDFSRDEVGELLQKANLPVNNDLLACIYEWTGGNPRMTWDLCSALEVVESEGASLISSDVDAVVERLYLRAFDRAPIDHIRDLVAADQSLRDAIVTVRYGKGETLEAKTRSRLYLAGVTRAAEFSPVIKSKIIDVALSQEWIDQLSSGDKPLLDRAIEAYDAKRPSDAIALLETWRRQNEDDRLKAEYQVLLAACHFALGANDVAATELRDAIPHIDSRSTTHRAKYLLASALLKMGDFEESLPILEEFLFTSGEYYYLASQALASALASLSAVDNSARIRALSANVIEELTADAQGIEQKDSIIAASYYNIGQALVAEGDNKGAEESLLLAQEIAPEDFRPDVMLARIRLTRNEQTRTNCAIELAEFLIGSSLTLPEHVGGTTRFHHGTLAMVIVRLVQADIEDGRRVDLVARLLRKLMPDMTPFEGLLDLFRRGADAEKPVLATLLAFALGRFSHAVLRDLDALEAYRNLAKHAPAAGWDRALEAYLSKFREVMRPELLGFEDLVVFLDASARYQNERRYAESVSVLELLKEFSDGIRESEPTVYVIILSYLMNAYTAKDDGRSARRVAQELVDFDNESADEGIAPELGATRRSLVAQAQRTIAAHVPDPFRHIGRNERIVVRSVMSGDERTMKFKHAEADLRGGKTELVRRGT